MKIIFTLITIIFISFSNKTLAQEKGSFKDSRDGKTYKTVKIGKQTWMAENLNFKTNKGSWCYKDSAKYCETYGRLYDWSMAMNDAKSSEKVPSGVQGVCPKGWHLPSDAEWKQLMDFLGGKEFAALKLKEKGSVHWYDPNERPDNSTGFTAIGGGYRSYDFRFVSNRRDGCWWSATEVNAIESYGQYMYYNDDTVTRASDKKICGLSVRCVKD